MLPEEVHPFRILDLPPELRNNIYEYAFANENGLAPHPITRTTAQLRKESLALFYDERSTISIDTKTAEQMTRLLCWISNSGSKDTDKVDGITFNYDHQTYGACRIVLRRSVLTPSDAFRKILASMHEDDDFLSSSNPTPATRHGDMGFLTWYACGGIPKGSHIITDCDTYDTDLAEPPELFWEAVRNGSTWISYHLEVFDSVSRARCFCDPVLARMGELLRDMHGQDWQDNMRLLRKLASELFAISLKARVEEMKVKVGKVVKVKEAYEDGS